MDEPKNEFELTDLFNDEERWRFANSIGEMIGNPDDSVCKGDPWQTEEILNDMGISGERREDILEFFRSNGGYCDCEVMLNVICGY